MNYTIRENKKLKTLQSPVYNYLFDKESGFFARWGKTKEDDPLYSPFGPEILDLEISAGHCSLGCKFCYKRNHPTKKEINLSLENFKNIFNKMPKTLTQIAFGLCDMHSNADFFQMCKYARENGVVPNFTTHGMDVTWTIAQLAARLCGALAVSVNNKEKAFNSIQMFQDAIEEAGEKATLRQINIHFMLSEETYDKAFQLVEEAASDPRLKNLNAIVFLQYKDKANLDCFHSLKSVSKYKKLIKHCQQHGIGFGFDSCSAIQYIKSIENEENSEQLMQLAESCESGIFSSYINVEGIFYACSFCEDRGEWENGINVLEAEDFIKDVWDNFKLLCWRQRLIASEEQGCRKCLMYDLEPTE
jgi:MoaA/NifB/PqqE/SkfB family radical SAM enzyme